MVQDFLLANSKGLLNVEYVQKHLDYIKDKCAVGVILPELKYAIMGGRISKFKGLVASVLKILTVVCFDGISLHKFDTAFSAKKIVEILCKDMIEKKFPNKKIKRIGLFINELHEDKFDDQKFSVLIKNQFKKYKISSYLLPSVIMVHAGPNYIGIAVEVE
jgi:fatty acid-binding protein DegV